MSLPEEATVVAAKAKPKAKRELTKAEKARRAKRRRLRRPALREADRALITKVENPNQVLTFRQWCLLAGFSVDTGRRLVASGHGPPVVQLSARRIGVRLGDHARWSASRVRGAV
jgi:hypothetical protein